MILRIKYGINKATATLLLICTLISTITIIQVQGFHLSFRHRLIKSIGGANTPQLNPASSLIRPIECKNANNQSEVGICMFSIDCMQNKGTPLSICKHNYFVGTCCKLPDYNNFVGIVYDLRDTDNNHVLEARRVSPTTTSTTSTTTTPQPITTVNLAPSPTSRSSSSPVSQRYSSENSGISSTLAPFPTIPATSSPSLVQSSPSSTSSESPLPSIGGLSLGEREKNKYFISSSNLFSLTPSTPPTTGQHSTTTTLLESSASTNGDLQMSSSSKFSTISQESPRNAEGSNQSPQAASQNGKLQIELDSFHIHQTTLPSSQPTSQQQHYDLISNSNTSSDVDSALEPVSTLNSAHSSLSQQQAFGSRHRLAGGQKPEAPQTQVMSAQEPLDTVYGLIGANSQPADFSSSSSKDNVVFANNHQILRSSTMKPIQTHQPTTTSDQEFTISTRMGAGDSSSIASSSQPAQSSVISQAAEIVSSSSKLPEIVEQIQNVTASPFVDLISSSASNQQTTTPFTTSLSTAILPNVSQAMLTYKPTEVPAISLVSNNNQDQHHRPPSTTQAPQTTITPPSTTTTSTTTRQPSSGKPSESLPALSLGQLYTSLSPSLFGGSMPSSTTTKPLYHNLHPGFHSMASSKIVPSSLPSSNSNNLIPGLSGLQSAILSHIPFKLASGLSSGLSSYLQAAMKPPASGNSRPLLASNTAPAQNYQLSLMNLTGSTFMHKPVSSTTTLVKFPSAAGVSSASPIPSNPSFDNTMLITESPSSWQFKQESSSSSLTTSTTVSPQINSVIDIVREAQQVCGKPQVASNEYAPGEAGKKRVARIVGGNQSSFGQWPWMVSLRQWRKGAFLHKCGAALLNENWAITAAHCVENVKANDLLLRLGEFDVSNQEEPYPFVERRVKTVVSHPSFDPKTFEYDLALLKFAEPIKYERNVIPVCVPSGNDSYVDRMATVIGWGRLYEDGPLPDIIQHVDVPIITNNECEKMYKNAGYIEEIPDMFICAGISKGGRDSCEGDSGGPLTMVDNDGRSYLVGIISWGIGCALPSQPGVYTRITAFSGWINQITSTT